MRPVDLPGRIEYGGDAGRLPNYAWPGGYPLFYWDVYGDVMCPDCANEHAPEGEQPDMDWPVGHDVHWEGPSMWCDYCGAEIESAYGDPDEDGDEE